MAKIVDTISNDNLNIKRTVVATRKSGKVAIEIQIDGKADVADLREKLLNQGIQVDALELTEAKSFGLSANLTEKAEFSFKHRFCFFERRDGKFMSINFFNA